MNQSERRWRGYALGVGAIAWAVLTELVRNSVVESLLGDLIGNIILGLLVVLALYWLISNRPGWWKKARSWGRKQQNNENEPVPEPVPTELQAYSEQAERWLVEFGSDGNGMAAAEWFRQEEPALRRLVAESEVRRDTVEALARICDALEAGYVRQRRAADLLELSNQLAKIGEEAGRRDLVELAAVRAATAYRLRGELDEATSRLGIASSLAPRGRTAAAMRARRELERGLIHLAIADRRPPGAGRTDAVYSARDRFDDAGLFIPRADHVADIAIHLNIAIVYLYQHNADKAMDHLRLAAARAAASRDASAQGHAQELTGIAAWLQGNVPQALLRWQEAQRRYSDVDERQGEARCLQHLGAAALLRGATDEARELLERSARLRDGSQGHEVLEHYLAQVRTQPDQSPEPPAEPTPRPDRIRLLERLRALWRKLSS